MASPMLFIISDASVGKAGEGKKVTRCVIRLKNPLHQSLPLATQPKAPYIHPIPTHPETKSQGATLAQVWTAILAASQARWQASASFRRRHRGGSPSEPCHPACRRPVPQQTFLTSFCERLVSSVLDSAKQFSTIQTETKPQSDLGNTTLHHHSPSAPQNIKL